MPGQPAKIDVDVFEDVERAVGLDLVAAVQPLDDPARSQRNGQRGQDERRSDPRLRETHGPRKSYTDRGSPSSPEIQPHAEHDAAGIHELGRPAERLAEQIVGRQRLRGTTFRVEAPQAPPETVANEA